MGSKCQQKLLRKCTANRQKVKLKFKLSPLGALKKTQNNKQANDDGRRQFFLKFYPIHTLKGTKMAESNTEDLSSDTDTKKGSKAISWAEDGYKTSASSSENENTLIAQKRSPVHQSAASPTKILRWSSKYTSLFWKYFEYFIQISKSKSEVFQHVADRFQLKGAQFTVEQVRNKWKSEAKALNPSPSVLEMRRLWYQHYLQITSQSVKWPVQRSIWLLDNFLKYPSNAKLAEDLSKKFACRIAGEDIEAHWSFLLSHKDSLDVWMQHQLEKVLDEYYLKEIETEAMPYSDEEKSVKVKTKKRAAKKKPCKEEEVTSDD